jgi:molybdenum cofactor synthesis domain-containing protein
MSEQPEKAAAYPSPALTAAILIIGNEILSGRTKDSNTSFIASRLGELGIKVREVRVVPDVKDRIIAALNTLRSDYTYVFTTGGIGPTHDDITADCVAAAFNVPLELHDDAKAMLLAHYGGDPATLTEGRLRMARIPQGSWLIPNPASGAPGFQIGNVFVMAGVPTIMQAMFDFLPDRLGRGEKLLVNTVTCNLGESVLALGMEKLQTRYAEIEIGSYPSFKPGVAAALSLVLRGTDADLLAAATIDLMALIKDCGGDAQLLTADVPV